MNIGGKQGHLTFRVASIGAVCVCLDELPDSEAIRGFTGRDSSVVAHELVSLIGRSCDWTQCPLPPLDAVELKRTDQACLSPRISDPCLLRLLTSVASSLVNSSEVRIVAQKAHLMAEEGIVLRNRRYIRFALPLFDLTSHFSR